MLVWKFFINFNLFQILIKYLRRNSDTILTFVKLTINTLKYFKGVTEKTKDNLYLIFYTKLSSHSHIKAIRYNMTKLITTPTL